jgi:Tfp pilus assembly major pilin PilA
MNAKAEAGTVAMEDLYRAAVGPGRADFYAPKFVQFDEPGASKVSWNWSAFLVSFYWFLYRRMYGYWAIYCLLIPFLVVMVAGIATAASRNPAIFSLADLGLLAYYYAIIPMYANALYHRKIKERIAAVRRKVPDPAVQVTVLENGPHTSAIAWVILLILFVPGIGILAAIAIPAYQNYVVRAQIYDGLTLAKPLEQAVVSHYGAAHQWPAGLSDIGMSQAPSDRYVASMDVDHGTVTITYGNQAIRLLAGQTLSLRPTFLSPDRITWTCGNAPPRGQDPDSGAAGSNQTDIADRYLPVVCRGSGNPVP